jgi:hypothetical protein
MRRSLQERLRWHRSMRPSAVERLPLRADALIGAQRTTVRLALSPLAVVVGFSEVPFRANLSERNDMQAAIELTVTTGIYAN